MRLAARRQLPQRSRSGRAFPVVSFVYLSVECPSNKFYRINCRPNLGAKLLDRFFHGRRQVSPPVNSLTHRFFDSSQHLLYCNFTVGCRHSVFASSFSRQAAENGLQQNSSFATSAISPHETHLRHFRSPVQRCGCAPALSIQQSLYWHEGWSTFVLDQEHQEFRGIGTACVPVNDMDIVRAFI